jgi:hypothetical protein
VRPLVTAGANVLAVELDPAWANALGDDPAFHGRLTVIVGDFLRFEHYGELDLAMMNPPLDGGVGPEHIAHALRFAPRVVSVLRTVDLHGVKRYALLWSKAHLAGIAYCIRRPRFGGAGAKEDFVIVDVRRAPADMRRPEWW